MRTKAEIEEGAKNCLFCFDVLRCT